MPALFHQHSIHVDGLNLTYEHRQGNGQTLVFLHATGFNKAVWYEVVKHLENPIYLFDVPGHGQSDHPEQPFRWDHTASWLAESFDKLGFKNAMGIGHSMGGQIILSIAHQLPDAFDQLMLLDPVVLREEQIKFLQGFKDSPITKRRNQWRSSQELYEVFSNKAPFADWQDQVLLDYAEQALKAESGISDLKLACAPHLEASVYQNNGSEHLLDKLSEIHVPVQIIRARAKRPDDHPMSFVFSPTRSDLVDLLPHAEDEQLEEWSHFFPMEYPEWLGDRIRSVLS